MKRPLSLLFALLVSAGLLLSSDDQADQPNSPVLAAQPASPTCKPEAPIRLELLPQDLVGGRARLDYVVTPVVDALAIDVSLEFPEGGNVRWHNSPSQAAAERGLERSGALSVNLPTDRAGVEVIVRAHISIPDAEAPDGIGIYTTSRTASWGEVDRVVLDTTEVVTDGELTLDTAATRL